MSNILFHCRYCNSSVEYVIGEQAAIIKEEDDADTDGIVFKDTGVINVADCNEMAVVYGVRKLQLTTIFIFIDRKLMRD